MLYLFWLITGAIGAAVGWVVAQIVGGRLLWWAIKRRLARVGPLDH